MNKDDIYFLKIAYKEALKAKQKQEVPIGAVIVLNNKIIAKGHNLKETKNNPLAHAEIIVINKAIKKLKQMYLNDAILYVTLEPCSMCAGAIIQTRIKKVVFGALDKKGGALISSFKMYSIKGFNHYPEIAYNEKLPECGEILTKFFQEKRKNDIMK